ncbi:heme ABC transporter permease [Aquisalimonas sp.]|uniref:heme ABC transporter permease n=1 Tax=Aquisalimonas sp. TaxID=1872621 RepID=UPI0025C6F2C0|nr:heme ABC transporter permease [Aquisalimonas sp.]
MTYRRIRWLKFTAPANFYALVQRLAPWLWAGAAVLAVAGLYTGFFVAPPDYQQGNSYRIMFIHVPTAWMGMFLYLLMAVYAVIYLVWRIKMADIMARSLAPTGALMTLLALWTGALWGAPTWGTFWVWDARLTSTLILLFLFLGYIALHAAVDDREKGGRAASLLALIGAVNVPIIYFSVEWWHTLHQGMSITLTQAPTMAPSMFTALLLMTGACWLYSAAVTLRRAQAEALERESDSQWVTEAVQREHALRQPAAPAVRAVEPRGAISKEGDS